MNFGTRKELLYAQTPFTELFHRFIRCLSTASTLIVAGYSFRDERVNRVVEEAVVSRKGSLRLIVVDPSVFRVASAMPTLWAFRGAGIAEFVDKPLGSCLADGSLRRAVQKMNALANGPDATLGWSTTIIPVPTPVSPTRDVTEISRLWRELRAHVDALLALHDRVVPAIRNDLNALPLPTDRMATSLGELIPLARQQMVVVDQIVEAMDFGPYFGPSAVGRTRLSPAATQMARAPQEIQEALAELTRWVDVAFNSYHFATEEFLNAVSDPEYGDRAGSPDNFSMAEMVSRGVKERIDEVLYALNGAFGALGYDEPFP